MVREGHHRKVQLARVGIVPRKVDLHRVSHSDCFLRQDINIFKLAYAMI